MNKQDVLHQFLKVIGLDLISGHDMVPFTDLPDGNRVYWTGGEGGSGIKIYVPNPNLDQRVRCYGAGYSQCGLDMFDAVLENAMVCTVDLAHPGSLSAIAEFLRGEPLSPEEIERLEDG